jgi:hypothetical protein
MVVTEMLFFAQLVNPLAIAMKKIQNYLHLEDSYVEGGRVSAYPVYVVYY